MNKPNFIVFLTDDQGKGFAKRLGSLSIELLKNEGYESITLLNYLLNIGSSKDIVPQKKFEKLINDFEIEKISSAPPKFSKEILKTINKNILQSYDFNEISNRLDFIEQRQEKDKIWKFVKNNIYFFKEINNWIDIIFSENFFLDNNFDSNFIDIAIKTLPQDPFDETTWESWTKLIEEKTGLKGKNLFMPLRIALTGKDKGPELKYLLPILNRDIILKKFRKT